MALSCRFCFAQDDDFKITYAVALTHGTKEKLMESIAKVEEEGECITGVSQRCETCGKMTVPSYNYTRLVYSDYKVPHDPEGACAMHYLRICLLHARWRALQLGHSTQ